jgi:hypothetical protein
MKRKQDNPPPPLGHVFIPEIERALSNEQLIGIGKVAVLWSDCEELMNAALYVGTRLPSGLQRKIVNGLAPEKKTKLMNDCASDLQMNKVLCDIIAKTVSAYGDLGDKRDSVVHSSVNAFEVKKGLGLSISRSGELYDVLRTKEALEGLANRLVILREELVAITRLFLAVKYTYTMEWTIFQHTGPASRPIEPLIEDLTSHQKRRESLPPLPKFPA